MALAHFIAQMMGLKLCISHQFYEFYKILAFSHAFFKKTKIYPTVLSIDLVSQLPRLPKKVRVISQKWAGIKISLKEISFWSQKWKHS